MRFLAISIHAHLEPGESMPKILSPELRETLEASLRKIQDTAAELHRRTNRGRARPKGKSKDDTDHDPPLADFRTQLSYLAPHKVFFLEKGWYPDFLKCLENDRKLLRQPPEDDRQDTIKLPCVDIGRPFGVKVRDLDLGYERAGDMEPDTEATRFAKVETACARLAPHFALDGWRFEQLDVGRTAAFSYLKREKNAALACVWPGVADSGALHLLVRIAVVIPADHSYQLQATVTFEHVGRSSEPEFGAHRQLGWISLRRPELIGIKRLLANRRSFVHRVAPLLKAGAIHFPLRDWQEVWGDAQKDPPPAGLLDEIAQHAAVVRTLSAADKRRLLAVLVKLTDWRSRNDVLDIAEALVAVGSLDEVYRVLAEKVPPRSDHASLDDLWFLLRAAEQLDPGAEPSPKTRAIVWESLRLYDSLPLGPLTAKTLLALLRSNTPAQASASVEQLVLDVFAVLREHKPHGWCHLQPLVDVLDPATSEELLQKVAERLIPLQDTAGFGEGSPFLDAVLSFRKLVKKVRILTDPFDLLSRPLPCGEGWIPYYPESARPVFREWLDRPRGDWSGARDAYLTDVAWGVLRSSGDQNRHQEVGWWLRECDASPAAYRALAWRQLEPQADDNFSPVCGELGHLIDPGNIESEKWTLIADSYTLRPSNGELADLWDRWFVQAVVPDSPRWRTGLTRWCLRGLQAADGPATEHWAKLLYRIPQKNVDLAGWLRCLDKFSFHVSTGPASPGSFAVRTPTQRSPDRPKPPPSLRRYLVATFLVGLPTMFLASFLAMWLFSATVGRHWVTDANGEARPVPGDGGDDDSQVLDTPQLDKTDVNETDVQDDEAAQFSVHWKPDEADTAHLVLTGAEPVVRIEMIRFNMDKLDRGELKITTDRELHMAKNEITRFQVAYVLGRDALPDGSAEDNSPALNISWDTASKFCDEISGRLNGFDVRLPHESEWLYATNEAALSDSARNQAEVPGPALEYRGEEWMFNKFAPNGVRRQGNDFPSPSETSHVVRVGPLSTLPTGEDHVSNNWAKARFFDTGPNEQRGFRIVVVKSK